MSRRNETLDAKIYVGGLPEDATSEELDDVFHRFGRIRKIWVARRPPGFAFVEFEDVRDAEDAVRALDGTRICGVKARVELSHGGGRGGGGRGFRGGGGRHDDRHDRDRHDRDRRYRSSNSATATIPSCPPVLPVILPPCHSPQFSLKNVLPSTPSLLIHLLASLFLRTAGRTKSSPSILTLLWFLLKMDGMRRDSIKTNLRIVRNSISRKGSFSFSLHFFQQISLSSPFSKPLSSTS